VKNRLPFGGSTALRIDGEDMAAWPAQLLGDLPFEQQMLPNGPRPSCWRDD